MVNYVDTKIRKYELFIRNILSDSASAIHWEKIENKEQKFTIKIKELFRLENELGWSFFCSSLDTIGDSNFAIATYKNDKVPTDITFNVGEQYLRLYGLLNAVYINSSAIMTMAELVKIKSAQLEKEFKDLPIIFIRNAVAAHPTNFISNNIRINYKIVRTSLSEERDILIVNHLNETKTFDLINAIDEYILIAENVLHNICLKLVKMRFKSNTFLISDLSKQLDEINLIK